MPKAGKVKKVIKPKASKVSWRTGKPKRAYTVSAKVLRHVAKGVGKNQGRKPMPINPKELLALAAKHATLDEIATHFGMTGASMTRRVQNDPALASIVELGRNEGKISLRHLLWNQAQYSDRTAIHLSKNVLGYTDKVEVNQNQTLDVNIRIEGDKAMAQWIELMRRQLRNGPQPQIVEVQAQKAG